jgi:hypothetical protein
MRDSEPARCAAHSGKVGAPARNRNAVKHGAYGDTGIEIHGIEDAVKDLEIRLAMVAEYTEGVETAADFYAAMQLYSQMVGRYGRLLRDQKVVGGEAGDQILEALAQAVDAVALQMGWTALIDHASVNHEHD